MTLAGRANRLAAWVIYLTARFALLLIRNNPLPPPLGSRRPVITGSDFQREVE